MNNYLELPESAFSVQTFAPTREGQFPIDEEMLRHSPGGHLFGFSQDAGMGWKVKDLNNPQVLILSTLGGLRKDDGTPIALGYHTGHWELGLLVRKAAEELKELGHLPFAGYCSDPCDGRSQGTTAMMESLPFRNSAAEVLGRLIRSLPRSKGVLGIATCDKGLPAMMMALAEAKNHSTVLIPGGVSLPPEKGEDAGSVQSIGARFSHNELTLKEAAELGCAACATPGGGCQFLGTAATSQVIAEALGMALPHSALAPSGQKVWLENATQASKALVQLLKKELRTKDILSEGSFRNAMLVHAAFGGSSNLLLHLPAVAWSAGLARPSVDDWVEANKNVTRFVDVLPNGPSNYTTVQVFLAGGVPEVMLHLRNQGLLDLNCLTVTGMTVGENLEQWEKSSRRQRFRDLLKKLDNVSPEKVILSPTEVKKAKISATLVFPKGNLSPEGSVIKCTAMDPKLFNGNSYCYQGRARVFYNETEALESLKSTGSAKLQNGDVMVLLCRGPIGAGMPETAQITIALKYTQALKNIPLLTDGRFSGFTSGPCIGHIGPEALAGGPVGKVSDGDLLEIKINRATLEGSINIIGDKTTANGKGNIQLGTSILEKRLPSKNLVPDPALPNSVKLWAALQQTGGGTWGGCVYDLNIALKKLSQ